MQFDSIYYLLFLPLAVFGYYLMPHRWRWAWLLLGSYTFYAFWRVDFLLLILFSTSIDYFCGLRMEAAQTQSDRRFYRNFSILMNVGLLVLFKYADQTVNAFLGWFGTPTEIEAVQEIDIILPIGISFYTFQTLSYSIDVYRGQRKAERHFGYFALFVSFFPQLVSGPIERSDALLPQLRAKHTFSWFNISKGGRLIIWGFFKKIAIANMMWLLVQPVLSEPEFYSGGTIVLVILLTAIWLYADFSAYIDIAIGSAHLLGIQLSQNFSRPYFKRTLQDVWRNWHITLTKWMRDYVYIPLGGNRKGKSRSVLNVIIIFVIIGLWHGASLGWMIFGFLHAFIILGYQFSKPFRLRLLRSVNISNDAIAIQIFEIVLTFTLWAVLFSLPMTDSIQEWWVMMTNLGSDGALLSEVPVFSRTLLVIVSFGVIVFFVLELMNKKLLENPMDNIKPTVIRWSLYYIFIFMTIALGHINSSEFFYFQF